MAKKPSTAGKRESGGRASAGGRSAALSGETRIAILVGPEAFLREEHTRKLQEALSAAHGEVQVTRFDGAQSGVEASAVLDECRTFGLLASHKLIVVDNADVLLKAGADEESGDGGGGSGGSSGGDEPTKLGSRRAAPMSKREAFERYAASPSDGATLVLRATTWRPGRLDKAVEALGPGGSVIKCETPGEEAAAAWVVQRAASHHKASIAPSAANLLVERLGPELTRLDTELEKLACAAPKSGKGAGVIDAALVGELVGLSRDEEAWVVQQELLSGDAERAVSKIRELIEVSRQPAIMVRFALADLARKLHGVGRGVRAGRNEWSLTTEYRLWGDSKGPVMAAAKRLEPEVAAALLKAAVEADHAAKTGRGDEIIDLELLAARFTSAMA